MENEVKLVGSVLAKREFSWDSTCTQKKAGRADIYGSTPEPLGKVCEYKSHRQCYHLQQRLQEGT